MCSCEKIGTAEGPDMEPEYPPTTGTCSIQCKIRGYSHALGTLWPGDAWGFCYSTTAEIAHLDRRVNNGLQSLYFSLRDDITEHQLFVRECLAHVAWQCKTIAVSRLRFCAGHVL